MSDIRTLLGAAESAALAVETAKGGVEAARQRVEEAKAELDAAKGVVETAKGELDAAYAACEEAGLPKAKAKRAVEGIIGLLAEVGVVAVAATANETASAPRAPRKPRQQRRGEETVADADASTTEGASADPAASTDEHGVIQGSGTPAPVIGAESETFQPTASDIGTASAVHDDDGAGAPDFLQAVLDNANAGDVGIDNGEASEDDEADAAGQTDNEVIAPEEEIPAEEPEVASADEQNVGVVLADAADLAVVDVDTPTEAADGAAATDLPSDGVELFDDADVAEPAANEAEKTDSSVDTTPPAPAPAPRGFGRPSFLPSKK